MRRYALHLLLLASTSVTAGQYTIPTSLSDGWSIADASSSGWDVSTLTSMEDAIASGAAPDTTSVLIVRNGELIYENYFNGGGREVLNNTRSATKSVTALLVGAAIDRHLIAGPQANVYSFFPDRRWHNEDPRKQVFTVEDLLTMSSQWECDDENQFSAGNEERMYLSADWTQFVLDLPIRGYAPWMQRPQNSPHGRAFAYCTANSFLLGAIIEQTSGKALETFARETLEGPLGIDQSTWLKSSEGVGMGGGGTGYRSRDLAKLGQLLLDEGRWQGHQIISSSWVRSMMTVRVQAREGVNYGYQIWQFSFDGHGRQHRAWAMSGNGGNYVFMIPEERLVAVITRTRYNQRDMHQQSHKILSDYILKAMP